MSLVWFLEANHLACVVGVRKGRGMELGHETRREGGVRRGTPASKWLFSPSRLLIKQVTKITQLWMTSCQISLAAMYVFWSYFLHCFSFVFLKQEILSKGTIKKVQMRSSIEGIFLESCNDACRVRGYSPAWIYSSCCWRNRAGKLFNKTCSSSSQLSMQRLSNKQTGSMLFPFFLLASNTDKPLGDDTFQNQSVRLICWQAFSFMRFLNCFFLFSF